MNCCGMKMKKVSNEDIINLRRRFEEEEIKDVVFQMKRNKASGPDEIPAEFYQDCWKIIKEDLLAFFDDLHASKLDLIIINYGIITLIKIKERGQ
jgi:hypothetical protein